MVNPLFAVLAVLGVLLPLVPSSDARTERRLYWTGASIASISAFLALYPPQLGGGFGLAIALAAGMVIRAYMSTSHIRIRGRTYAFGVHDRLGGADIDSAPHPSGDPRLDPAPDSYGGFATAAKTWWLLAVITIACAFIVAVFLTEDEGRLYALGAAAVMVLVPLLAGHQDASWEYRVARGQWVPFAVISVATLGTFTALYAAAYAVGRRWPLRPKRSMEYRAHPHLRKKFP